MGGEALTRKEAILRPRFWPELLVGRSYKYESGTFWEGTHISTINKTPMPNAIITVTIIPAWSMIKTSIWQAELWGFAYEDSSFDSCTDNYLT